MENSYKFDDNSTKETAIEIPKNQYSPQEDNQDRTKMSLPVNINVASPFLRLVLKNVYVEYRHQIYKANHTERSSDKYFYDFLGNGLQSDVKKFVLGQRL